MILTSHSRHTAKHRQKITDEIKKIKSRTPCVDCGNCYPPEAMEFDHIVPVSLTGDKPISGVRSVKELYKELIKVEIRCANCHAIRTHQEGHNKHLRKYKSENDLEIKYNDMQRKLF
jgi:5-methylcytosine-specific restriction endonuclease McrA